MAKFGVGTPDALQVVFGTRIPPRSRQVRPGTALGGACGWPRSLQVPSLNRVTPGNPNDSYLIRKLEGGPNIINARMPFGGPFLDQTTIDSIRQWITNGAAQ